MYNTTLLYIVITSKYMIYMRLMFYLHMFYVYMQNSNINDIHLKM